MSIWWSLHLRREAATVPLARRMLLGAMDSAGVDPEISYDLAVALSEACANAVEHGSGGADGYRVTACIDGDTCHIEVTDGGPGFPAASAGRPAAPPPPGAAAADAEDGRGLYLIETLADHVRFANRPQQGGAVVSFDKILKWRDDALVRAG
ncbi:ATP-binding protein [Streptomyces sp. DSM 42041]|uniref:ATP-binding protein n=1 Tax=Streptomyces hazeniae TaxID=3075538 RepID=A0ABU2NPH9_9ACTN|nr:ATP-binding protein [Streptomyces sp. DSM 42041]MDT0378879.1 ATP-binding protein [Streptomyces sp. DSM 42041]